MRLNKSNKRYGRKQKGTYTTKHTTKRILAILLAALMLRTAVACTGSGDPADTDESVSADTTLTATDGTTAEPETEPETEPPPEDFVVTEEGGTATVPGDNTWRVTASDANVFFNFNPKRSWSFAGEDFPVFGMLVRNIWVDGGTAWYAAGEVAGAL